MTSGRGKVLVAMSGGVDSSVAACLLRDQGYEVVGCFMRLGSPGEELQAASECRTDRIRIGHQGCCSINDAKDAQIVAAHLGIPLYVLNFKADFNRVIDYFAAEYNAGRTPNPCVRCNDWLKFGRLWDYARSIEAPFVASGHYARIEMIGGRPALLRGVDQTKDQSYVLFGARPENLAHTLLPVGGFQKSEIRRIARERGLPVFDKPDSQEICFVPDNDYAGLLKRRTPDSMKPGEIVDPEGKVVGTHEGHQHFTIGQRRGLGVAMGYPIYVVGKDVQSNRVTIGPPQMLLASGLVADQVNWLADDRRPEGPASSADAPTADSASPHAIACQVKIRYNAQPVAARCLLSGPDELTIWFDEPQSAVAPGQAAVCYDGDRLLGGGWIARTLPAG